MVETPMVTAFKLDSPEADNIDPFVSSDDEKKQILSATLPEVLVVKTKPITAKIRTTMKHLRTQAGPWSRFRGLHIYMIYHFLFFVSYAILQFLFRLVYIPRAAAAVTTHVIMCQFGLMWTHVVISTPSTQPWYKRTPTFATVKLVVFPTVIFAGAEQLVFLVSRDLLKAFGLHHYVRNPGLFAQLSSDGQRKAIAQISTIGLISTIAGFLVIFPAYVALTRVYASALPEQDESIVPFDRTFGGRTQPRTDGGHGVVSMLDAWRTFDWAARIRLIKLYAKIFAIEFSTTLFFGLLMLGQLRIILGPQMGRKATLPQ